MIARWPWMFPAGKQEAGEKMKNEESSQLSTATEWEKAMKKQIYERDEEFQYLCKLFVLFSFFSSSFLYFSYMKIVIHQRDK